MPLTAKIRIALANVLKAEPEPATCNTFFNTEQSTNSFTIIHNMNNEKYGMDFSLFYLNSGENMI